MTAPAEHPPWCDQAHGYVPAHSGQIGDDIELTSELAFAVYVARAAGRPAEVQLLRHAPDETSLTSFTPLQAGILRDLLAEALGVLAREAGLR